MTAPRRRLGDFGERVAVARLERDGLRVLERNVRLKAGEIDLIAEDGADLAFVEVRTRRASAGISAESLITSKLDRMWRCAAEYCIARDIDPGRIRLDAIAVSLDASGRVTAIEHYRGLELPG